MSEELNKSDDGMTSVDDSDRSCAVQHRKRRGKCTLIGKGNEYVAAERDEHGKSPM